MKTRKLIARGICLPALATLPVTVALAEDNEPDPPQDGWTFGPVLGLTSANTLSFVPGYGGYYEFKSRTGIAIGASARKFRKFNQKGTAEKFFAPELGYRAFGMRMEEDDVSMSLNENQIAASFLFQTRWGNDKGWQVLPHFTWGPQLGYALSYKAEACYDDDCTDYDFAESAAAYFGGIVRVGLGMNIGAGVNLQVSGKTVDVSLRYYQGLAPRLAGGGPGGNTQFGLFGGIYF